MDEDGMSHLEDFARSRAEEILEQILSSRAARMLVTESQHTYSDQPILQTGADFARERAKSRQEGRPAARTARGQRAERRHQVDYAAASRPAQPTPFDEVIPSWLSFSLETSRYSQRSVEPADSELPPTLRELRRLEGEGLRSGELFCRQARLAAMFEDSLPFEGFHPYRYLPTYKSLGNLELRGYFTWRTAWRRGTAADAPATYATILAFELINGVGAAPGAEALARLHQLEQRCADEDARGRGPSVTMDIRRWERDYAICVGLDVRQTVPEADRSFGSGVETLRAMEHAELLAKGLIESQSGEKASAPTDDEVMVAMGNVSTIDVSRSPFVRAHQESFAAVAAAVARRMAVHCNRRRKAGWVDGLVGYRTSWPFTPLAGVPLERGWEGPDRTVRVCPGQTVSYRFGRWTERLAYSTTERSRDLARLLRAIDRQMRIDWGFGHPLKDQRLPRYLDKMVVEESRAQHEREKEAERRRFRVDLSKLGGIRSAAAVTREALLVDEEREDHAPGDAVAEPASAPLPPAGTAAQPPAAEPAPEQSASAPLPDNGLTTQEQDILGALLAHKSVPVAMGTSVDMLVDSINEKLFDLMGDTVLEFGEDGPAIVEDYEQDLRGYLQS
ncbi:TerB N-terminal domain-containing protein [Olsenella sp. Marseille-P4559]|uniref:TerB N-terminal domain-containing protein n=1 Tax=Olsenella sp. Marseille-P4559 TaxID=2364795 RepID=UPI0013EF1D36|nr:TerB N-terminal domain-containing protein [Olsenella sp. Marseille-P4559]